MVPIFTFLALLATTFAAPAPSERCNALIEEYPWILSNIVAFDAALNSSAPSYISFHFCDYNSGLELDTECTRQVAAGNGSIIDGNNWYACENNAVLFMYSGDAMGVQRSYTDPCLGPYPYDMTTAFGNAGTNVTNITSPAGSTCTQTELFVKITEEA